MEERYQWLPETGIFNSKTNIQKDAECQWQIHWANIKLHLKLLSTMSLRMFCLCSQALIITCSYDAMPWTTINSKSINEDHVPLQIAPVSCQCCCWLHQSRQQEQPEPTKSAKKNTAFWTRAEWHIQNTSTLCGLASIETSVLQYCACIQEYCKQRKADTVVDLLVTLTG